MGAGAEGGGDEGGGDVSPGAEGAGDEGGDDVSPGAEGAGDEGGDDVSPGAEGAGDEGDVVGNFSGVPKTSSNEGVLAGSRLGGASSSPSAPEEVSGARSGEAAGGALTSTAGDGGSSTTWSALPRTALKTSSISSSAANTFAGRTRVRAAVAAGSPLAAGREWRPRWRRRLLFFFSGRGRGASLSCWGGGFGPRLLKATSCWVRICASQRGCRRGSSDNPSPSPHSLQRKLIGGILKGETVSFTKRRSLLVNTPLSRTILWDG